MEHQRAARAARRSNSVDCADAAAAGTPRRSSVSSASPERVSDVERRSFLRAYSRKSLESNPEDEEFVVGDDGTISVVAVDDRARLERLRQVLEKKDRETRLAAEYGLSLLESNEELHLEIESLKIQHEAEAAELVADRELYRRRHELALQEAESWRTESKRQEELKYQLSAELEQLSRRCACLQDGGVVQRQQQRIAELEVSVADLQASEAANGALIAALQQWKTLHESAQKEQADLAFEETASDKLYVDKLEQDAARLRAQVEALRVEKQRYEVLLTESEDALKAARREIDELHGKVKLKEAEIHEQAELLLTAESKCSRLERERTIMEQVANLPVAMYDRDDDDDEEDDDDEDAKAYGGYGDDSDNRFKGDNNDSDSASEIEDPTAVEDWFNHNRSASGASLADRGSMTPASAVRSFGNNQRIPSTPSSLATHQKLHHYFHLTALSIIHENNLHEQCFDSSSRATIDTWYDEVVDQGIQFLEWHSWLINRIGVVAAAMQKEEQALEQSFASQANASNSSNSPFRAFMRRRENSKAQEPSNHAAGGRPPPHPYGYSASPAAPPTPRVSSSVAWSLFSRLVGRRDNQDSPLAEN